MVFGEKLIIGSQAAQMTHKFISAVNPGEQIEDVYMVTQPVLRSTTRGDFYIAMFLGDRTGKINGRMWQASEAVFNSIPREGFVRIRGRSELYQGAMQIVVDHLTVVPSDKVNLEDFLARTTKDVGKMFESVQSIMATVKDPSVKALTQAFLNDKALMEKFCKAPAAINCHHNYLGGLLEHTSTMLQSAKALLPLYPYVQGDLVLAGIFLHDIGKTEELAYDMAFSYTDGGQLIGHIVGTVVMISKKADELAQNGTVIPKPILENIQHIIVSHHGKYEFGSPKLPATPEAYMVNYIDDLDAKMSQVSVAIDTDPGDDTWTAFKPTLQTRLYRKKVIS